MKNFLWFLYKPRDERERELYYKAYARAFSFVILILFVSFFVLRITPYILASHQEFSQFVTPAYLALYVLVIIIIAYLIGWTTLRGEDIEKSSDLAENLPSIRLVWGLLGGLYIIFMVVSVLSKEFAYNISIILGVVWVIAVRIIAWRSTDKLQLPIRLLLVICIPLLTTIFSRLPSQGFLKRLGKAALVGIGVHVISLVVFLWPSVPRIYHDFKVNSLSCDVLPVAREAQAIILSHKENLEEAIKKTGELYDDKKIEVKWVIQEDSGYAEGFKEGSESSFISIGWGEREECEGKGRDGADILIVHNTQKEREVIEKLFGETFFGIPYRFWDV